MRRRRSLKTIVVGRNSLRKDGLTQFLRSADFGMVTSVMSADDLCASRINSAKCCFSLSIPAMISRLQSRKSSHSEAVTRMGAWLWSPIDTG